MRVSIETADGLTRKLTIAVPSDTFEGEFDGLVTRKATEVKLPGFRPGKVPTSEVRRRFGPQLRQEVASELLKTSLEEAVREQDLSLASPADVQIVNLDAGTDFEFTATFEVMPEFELADLSGLTVRQPVAEVTDADVDTMVETLRQQRVTWHAVEREAREGDRLTVDYSLSVAGERVTEGEGRTLIVGSPGLLPELDQAVRGMSAGEERAFPATLPPAPDHASGDDRGDQEAGAEGVSEDESSSAEPGSRQAIGQVTVQTVEESKLPEVDDDFYDQFDIPGAEGEAAEDGEAEGEREGEREGVDRGERFRDDVRERMTVELNNALRQARRQEALAVLARSHGFELPRAMVEAQVAQEQARLRQMVADVPDELPSVFVQIAEQRVRVQLAINKIVATESITVDDQRVRDRIDEVASAYEESAQVRNAIYADENQLAAIEASVLEEQVVDHILDRAQVQEVATTYADAMNGQALPVQTDEPPADADVTEEAQEAVAEDRAEQDLPAAVEPSVAERGADDRQDVQDMQEQEQQATEAGLGGRFRRMFGKRKRN